MFISEKERGNGKRERQRRIGRERRDL